MAIAWLLGDGLEVGGGVVYLPRGGRIRGLKP
jgi:hypothetical protein